MALEGFVAGVLEASGPKCIDSSGALQPPACYVGNIRVGRDTNHLPLESLCNYTTIHPKTLF